MVDMLVVSIFKYILIRVVRMVYRYIDVQGDGFGYKCPVYCVGK